MKLCLQLAMFLSMLSMAQPSSAVEGTGYLGTSERGDPSAFSLLIYFPVARPDSEVTQAHFLPAWLPRLTHGKQRRKPSGVQKVWLGKSWVINLSVAARQYKLT